ncbi:MAG: hypothetical protein P4L31_03530, partial [Candidatus Babeliales bacterium]|nr:hypothetical protein [Candidatus Babeliales bacterium]
QCYINGSAGPSNTVSYARQVYNGSSLIEWCLNSQFMVGLATGDVFTYKVWSLKGTFTTTFTYPAWDQSDPFCAGGYLTAYRLN